MYPDCASRRVTISCRMLSNDSTEISRSCWLSISTKRDMCVPLKLCGRCTYMLKVAMVCCTPTLLSLTLTGWRIPLMPTRSAEDSEGAAGSADTLAAYMKDPTPGVVLVFDAPRFDFEGEDKKKQERVRKFFA